MAKSTTSQRRRSRPTVRKGTMVFQRRNYLLLAISVALIVIGYVIMRAENEVDGFISLYVSPILLLAGYIGVGVAILWHPKAPAAGTSE